MILHGNDGISLEILNQTNFINAVLFILIFV